MQKILFDGIGKVLIDLFGLIKTIPIKIGYLEEKMRSLKSTILGLCVFVALNNASIAEEANLPPIPSWLKSEGVLKVGVRCDQPPYGFKDSEGNFAGIETAMALQIAEWAFGSKNKAELTCVTAANRIQQLLSKKVDILYATLGVTPERARVVQFSAPYRWDGSDVVLLKNSKVKTLADLKGKTIIVLKGDNKGKWFEQKMPEVHLLQLNSTAAALQALKQGRADGAAFDTALIITLLQKDKSLRRLDDSFLLVDAAAGLRKNEPGWLAYVNAAQNKMKEMHLYSKWAKEYSPAGTADYYTKGFETPRPDKK